MNTAVSDFRVRLRSSTIWGIAFQLSSKTALFIVSAIAARMLSVSELGSFVSAQGAIILSAAVADRGLSLHAERGVASRLVDFGSVRIQVKFRIVESAVALVLGFAIIRYVVGQSSWEAAWLALALAATFISTTTNALLQGQLRFKLSAISLGAGRIGYLVGIVAIAVVGDGTLVSVTAVWALSETAISCFQLLCIHPNADSVRSVRRLITRGVGRDQRAAYTRLMRNAFPYWISVIAYLAYNRADSTIVLICSDAHQAGIYAPASAIQNAVMIVPAAITGAVATVGSSALADNRLLPSELLVEIKSILKRSIFISLATVAVCEITMTFLIKVFVGNAYLGSITPARILILSIPLNAVEFAMLGLLIALGRPSRALWFYLVSFSASVALNIILTPRLGAVGGAIAGLGREPAGCAILLLMTLAAFREVTSSGGLHRVGRDHLA